MIKTTLSFIAALTLGACAHPPQGYVVYSSGNSSRPHVVYTNAPTAPARPPLYIYNPPPTYCYPPSNYTVAPRVCNVQPWSDGTRPRPTVSGYVPPDPWAPVSAPRINAPGQRIIVPQPW